MTDDAIAEKGLGFGAATPRGAECQEFKTHAQIRTQDSNAKRAAHRADALLAIG